MKLNTESEVIRTRVERSQQGEHSSPIYMTSSFQFESAEHMQGAFSGEIPGNVYSRYTNPNVDEFSARLAIMEGAEGGHSTASGMSAVFACFMTFLGAGDHLLACRSIFGSTHGVINKWLPKYGIQTDFLEVEEIDQWESKFLPNTKMLYLETPTNPGLAVIDIQKVADVCKAKGVILVVDNCFATPVLQRPIEFGADLVVHSATKFLDGQGRGVGGAIIGKQELIDEIVLFCRSTGPSLSPFNAWMFSKSLETLAVRMDRHSENAMKVAQFLTEKGGISKVVYPFLENHPQYSIAKKQMTQGGGLVAFELEGGISKGQDFLNALQMCSLTANLGDTKTIVSHPASTTHSRMTEEERALVGITDGFIRISVGLEHSDDIIADLQRAFESLRK